MRAAARMSELSGDFAIVCLSSLLSIHRYYLQSILSHTKDRCCSEPSGINTMIQLTIWQRSRCYTAEVYDSIASAIIILICLPVLAFWCVVTYRLLAEQKASTDIGSQSKPDQPPMLMIFA